MVTGVQWIALLYFGMALWGSPLWARTETCPPVLHVAYFIPSDRTPEPDRIARLDRVMTEVQRFYRDGMKQNGFGPMSFELDRNSSGALKVHEVWGVEPMRNYDRNDSEKVRREVKAALAKVGLDIDSETVVIFEQLLEWQGDKAIEVGPYVGGGGTRCGTAWVFDDAKLDPALLSSKDPGGYYNGPCSIGQFNTHYIGGVAHELGHALGLPHDRERDSEQSTKGHSLMGSGNHTYGQQLRGQGPGTFLSAASALPLSAHPLFSGKRRPPIELTCRIVDLTAAADKGKLTLSGRLEEGPKTVGIVAYNDAQDIADDYDALGWTSEVDSEGRFRFVLEDLRPVNYELRLAAISETGERKTFVYHYTVSAEGMPDIWLLLESERMQKALDAFRNRDARRLEEIANEVKRQQPGNAQLLGKFDHLQTLLLPLQLRSLDNMSADTKTIKLTDLTMDSMTVGWGRALRNQVFPEDSGGILLEVGGAFFESGLYAHAPARHTLRLDRGWTTFETKFGLQDGHDGSVVFVIKGDGRELFRSRTIRDHKVRERSIPVAEIDFLELVVENAGDGNSGDWGVWLEPILRR